MWRWKPREKIGEQRVTDGRRLGTDGEKQRGTRRDQESLAQRGTPGSWGDRPLEGDVRFQSVRMALNLAGQEGNQSQRDHTTRWRWSQDTAWVMTFL